MKYVLINDIWLILFAGALFFDLALFSPFIERRELSLFAIVLTVLLNAALLVLTVKTAGALKKCCAAGGIWPQIKGHAKDTPVLFIIAVYVLIKICLLHCMLRWDGAFYFDQLLNSVRYFDFTLDGFIEHFNWFGHPSMGYAAIMALGQFIDWGNHSLLHLQNLILSVLAVGCFYKILTYFYGDNPVENALVTALFAFNPLFFGVSSTFSIDFPLLVFWTASICALLYKRYILFVFGATLLVFSKEPGMLMYFLFVVAYLFFKYTGYRSGAGKIFPGVPGEIMRNNHVQINQAQDNNQTGPIHAGQVQTGQNKPNRVLSNQTRGGIKELLCLFLPLLFFSAYLLFTGGLLWGHGSVQWSGNEFNAFGIDYWLMKERLGQIFILNFGWLQTLIILLFIFKVYLCPTGGGLPAVNVNNKRNDILKAFVFVFLGFVVFNLLYITHTNPRYVLPAVFFLLVFSYHALWKTFQSQKIRVVILSFLVLLSFGQTFKTIDPLSKAFFGTTAIGNHQLLNIGPGDGLTYNAQYLAIDILLDKLNKDINITEDTKIILSEVDWFTHYNGAGPYTSVYINADTLERTFKKEQAFQPETLWVWDINEDNKPEQAYYVYMFWVGDKEAEIAHLSKYYTVTETRTVDWYGYYFEIYTLKGERI